MCKYMKVVYDSETISIENNNEFFSTDESLINHKNAYKFGCMGPLIIKVKIFE